MTSRTSGTTTSYGYDARGLRVVSQVGIGGKTFYVFSGDTLIGEVNGAGQVQRAYTWGANGLVSERLVPQSRSLWYHFGPQGETRQLTNASGAVADSYVYSAYGQPVASTATDANPFRYGGAYGYYTDNNAGLALCTRRWYDPDTARWLSRDPSGYDGGDNLYGYCLGDPVNLTDPTGLQSIALPFPGVGLGTAGAAGEGGAGLAAAGPIGVGIVVTGVGIVAGWHYGNVIGDHFFGPQTYKEYGPSYPITRAAGDPPPNLSPPGSGRRGALREAKRRNGVPVSMPPSRVGPNIDKRGNVQPGRQYEYDLPGGKTVKIREDSGGHDYGPGDPQNRGPHFNDPEGNHYDCP